MKKVALSFRSPENSEWRPLIPSNHKDIEEKKAVEVAKDALKNMLLSSLQMQHLVVLAGCGCSLAAGGPAMSRLWQKTVGEDHSPQARRIARKIKYDLNDENIEAFLSQIELYLRINDDNQVRAYLDSCKETIIEECSKFLSEDKLNAHKTFLHRLSRRRARDQRLKVFTTNYDLCFERAASQIGGVVLDGFSFSSPRHYDPRYFSYDIIRRPRNSEDLGSFLEGVFLLYKLHGSTNWARGKNGVIHEKDCPSPEEACLIYPASEKYQQSFAQPHLESIAQYLSAVREPNTCLIVAGFGFNDDHLAEPLLAAVRSNPHMRLIIVDPEAQKMTTDGEHKYWRKFSRLSKEGEDVWFVNATFDKFVPMLPDLKSLTPAESLMKAIKGISRES